MAFDVNNFVIDHVLRGTAFSMADGSVLFTINQIQNPSLNCASESNDAVDALGTPIATFYRAKSAEFSAENALYDMNLMATQLGTTKKIATVSDTIVTPAFETWTVVPAGTSPLAPGQVVVDGSLTLVHTPTSGTGAAPVQLFLLNGDSTIGKKFSKGDSASATAFAISGKQITIPTGLNVGDQLYVMYEYNATQAVEVLNSATEFPTGCKFVMEVLGCDVCDQTTKIYAYLIFPNAKLSPDFDWSIATDGAHPFSMNAQQDYCDPQKKLFSIIVPDPTEDIPNNG